MLHGASPTPSPSPVSARTKHMPGLDWTGPGPRRTTSTLSVARADCHDSFETPEWLPGPRHAQLRFKMTCDMTLCESHGELCAESRAMEKRQVLQQLRSGRHLFRFPCLPCFSKSLQVLAITIIMWAPCHSLQLQRDVLVGLPDSVLEKGSV